MFLIQDNCTLMSPYVPGATGAMEEAAELIAELEAAVAVTVALAPVDDAAAVELLDGELDAAGVSSEPHAASTPKPAAESPATRRKARRLIAGDESCGRMSGLIIISRFRLCFHHRMRET